MKTIYYILFYLTLTTSSFSQVWITNYGTTGENKATAITVDTSGNIYTTGFAQFTGQGANIVLLKYNSAGQLLWAVNFNGTASNEDKAYAITVDANNFIYVAGFTDNISSGNDITVLKYNTNGVLQWAYNYSSTGYNEDKAYAITVDDLNRVYIGGYVTRTNGTDYAVIALNNLGVQQWIDFYNGTGNAEDKVFAITVDNNGKLSVTGSSMGLVSTGLDYFTISYNTNGSRSWTSRYNGTGNSDDIARSIGNQGSKIVITGSSKSSNTAGSEDYLTIEYTDVGTIGWVHTYNGTGNNEDIAYSVSRISGLTYITGSSRNGAVSGTEDIVTVKLNGSGAQQWVNRFDGIGSNTDIGYSIVATQGNVTYITGSSKASGSNNSEDIITLKYDNNGTMIWNSRYNGPNNKSDVGIMIKSFNNDVYITGYCGTNGASNSDIITAGFTGGNMTSITQISNIIPSGFSLKQNYPNPFNPSTKIEFSVPISGIVKIELFDVLGNLKDILVKQNLNPGVYSLDYKSDKLSSGVYMYRISAGDYIETKKMILLK